MRKIKFETIAQKVAEMFVSANYNLPKDTLKALMTAAKAEKKPLARSVLKKCIENARIATQEQIPVCQDTGLAVFFVEMGDEVKIEGGLLSDAINQGVGKGCREGYLRPSSVEDPVFKRKNTKDCTPAIIHLKQVKGDKLKISLTPKGGGAENTSKIAMLNSADGKQGIIDFVVGSVISAGGNPCPPTVVGVGIGGNFERCAILAKKALLRPLGSSNRNKKYAELERKILRKINISGVGAQGFGGDITSFAVHIEYEPCHIASMPVAVNLNCWVHRHKKVVL
jgi:fumarate hydratase subunit alpha